MLGSFHFRHEETPLGTVLIVNLLGKGLTLRPVWEIWVSGDGLLMIMMMMIIKHYITLRILSVMKNIITVSITISQNTFLAAQMRSITLAGGPEF